jgi:uncharacterized protein (DUF2236 family)
MKKTTKKDLEPNADAVKDVRSKGHVELERERQLRDALDRGRKIVMALDLTVREELRHKPEAIAEWDQLMREHADVLTNDEAEALRAAEESKLDEQIGEMMDRINDDLDQYIGRPQPDLEVDAALERNLAAMRDVDLLMRRRYRDDPAQLQKWEYVINYAENVSALGRELEDSFPAN